MRPAVEPEPLRPGDTVAWTAKNRTKAWGLVGWTEREGVHVQVRTRTGDHPRHYLIPYARVREHHQGRAEHDRHM